LISRFLCHPTVLKDRKVLYLRSHNPRIPYRLWQLKYSNILLSLLVAALKPFPTCVRVRYLFFGRAVSLPSVPFYAFPRNGKACDRHTYNTFYSTAYSSIPRTLSCRADTTSKQAAGQP